MVAPSGESIGSPVATYAAHVFGSCVRVASTRRRAFETAIQTSIALSPLNAVQATVVRPASVSVSDDEGVAAGVPLREATDAAELQATTESVTTSSVASKEAAHIPRNRMTSLLHCVIISGPPSVFRRQ